MKLGHRTAVVILLCALAMQCVMSMRQNSLTEDEYVHVPAGLSYLRTNIFRLNLDEPPLMKLLAAAPLLAWRPEMELPLGDESWREKNAWQFARRFFDTHHRDLDFIVILSRVPTVFLSVILGLLVYRWAGSLYGAGAGVFALLLYVFEPNILAHSALATMDLGVSLFILAGMYVWWKFHRAPTVGLMIGTGLMIGMAAATKFSGLILIPLSLALSLSGMFLEGGVGGQDRLVIPWRQLLRGLTRWTGVLAAAGMVIFFIYGMEWEPLATDPEMIKTLGAAASAPDQPAWKQWVYRAAIDVPIPAPSYIKGISYLLRHFSQGHDAYLMGQYSRHGWWYYFIVSFLIKTTIPFLLLVVLSFLPLGQKSVLRGQDRLFLLGPPLALYALALGSPMNIGHRHILPIYPFLCIWCSGLMTKIPRTWWRSLFLAVLAAWHIVSAVSIYPHYLAYFNGLIGGPKNGPRYLLDSNIDWGQDLSLLKQYLDREQMYDTHLELRGNVSPAYYGLTGNPITPYQAAHPVPGNYALRVNELYNLHHPNKGRFQWLRNREPAARVGYSIYVYRISAATASKPIHDPPFNASHVVSALPLDAEKSY